MSLLSPLRRLGGEPMHPPTTHFPLALFPAAVLFDVLALWQGRGGGGVYTEGAFVLTVAGSVMALAAILTGFVQLLDVLPEERAWSLTMWHMSLQLVAVTVVLGSLVLRLGHRTDAHAPYPAIALGVAGTVLLLGGGWLGGRLVFRHGVGVETAAPEPATPQPAAAPAEATQPHATAEAHPR